MAFNRDNLFFLENQYHGPSLSLYTAPDDDVIARYTLGSPGPHGLRTPLAGDVTRDGYFNADVMKEYLLRQPYQTVPMILTGKFWVLVGADGQVDSFSRALYGLRLGKLTLSAGNVVGTFSPVARR